MVFPLSDAARYAGLTKAAAKAEKARAEALQIKEFWDVVDEDNSGTLDRGEISDLLRLMIKTVRAPRIDALPAHAAGAVRECLI